MKEKTSFDLSIRQNRKEFPRRDKIEFAYKYRSEIQRLLDLGGPIRTKWISAIENDTRLLYIRHIARRARTEIGYSVRTADCDICWSIIRHYKHLIL